MSQVSERLNFGAFIAFICVNLAALFHCLIAHLFEEFIINSFRINLGLSALNVFGPH